ncbi:hypothetical protein AG1IA_04321 [Rhizoctonia solani AG-1 IA]|uniref:Phosphoribosyltransferase domain-containing protein n=1 Tax=Thanatephorus cucumeris (strain AG1-IA) TaxID=983506 RepID=L8WUH9_THACA|nr:hypothetical protein AG1IA_04321 [Rhizoctonia solani AG-1 IA]
MTDAMLSLFPTAPVYHIGLFREKVSLQPVECKHVYQLGAVTSKLITRRLFETTQGTDSGSSIPCRPFDCHWWNCHCGGTYDFGLGHSVYVIPMNKIKFLGVLASQAGLDHVKSEFPELEIWFAAVDPELTTNGLIKPGLGDTVSAIDQSQDR